jgi:hypothetical protein
VRTHKTLLCIGLSLLILTFVLVPAVTCLAAEPLTEGGTTTVEGTLPTVEPPGDSGGSTHGYVWGG